MAFDGLPDFNFDGDGMRGPERLAPSAAARDALIEPLDARAFPHSAEVVVIGGGPAGLAASILLAQRGVDVLLLERRDFTGHFPRAHLLNVRTMEIFHDMGVSDDIYALSPPDDEWHKVVWCTSLAGPTPLHGLRIGEVPAWGGGDDYERYAVASPRKFANLAQIRLDRLLWEHADAVCPGRIRAHQEVTGLGIDEDGGGATVVVTDRNSGTVYEVRAEYVIAADGGRTVAGLLGIEMQGPRELLDQVSLYVTTDLSKWAADGVLIHKLLTPEGQGNLSGSLLALGPRSWGRHSEEWQISRARAVSSDEEDTDEEDTAILEEVRRLWGIPGDHPIDVHAVSHWQYEGVVASKFRKGPVFLVGDAAHRHPPTGGLGLNAGVQDSHNLSWKLALVLAGVAGNGLLETYETERRPVAAHYVAHALENAGRHLGVAAGLGQRAGQTLDAGWKGIEVWASDTPEGERAREVVAEAIGNNAEDFSQLNVEAGFAYESGSIVQDGTPPQPNHDSATEFVPTARPGHHIPHVWLGTGDDRVSSSDLVASEGLTLVVGTKFSEGWREAAAACARPGLPITVISIGASGDYDDPDGAWEEVVALGESGALLVRPDRHVAWRTGTYANQITGLATAVTSVLAGDDESRTDRATPYIARMWEAGERLRSN